MEGKAFFIDKAPLISIAAVVQLLSCVWLFATPWTAAHQASLSFAVFQFAQTCGHWVGDAIQPSHPLLPPSTSALNLSQHHSFPVSRLYASGGQSIGVSASGLILFTHSVVSNSLWPHELEQARPPCPSPTPGVYSNSCPLSQWCHPTISSSVVPFSSHLQSFPVSGSFQWVSSSHQLAKVLEFQL